MFYYYGSKSKVVNYYPKPKYSKIIEPFCGSAKYSLKYFWHDIELYDKDQAIIDIWHFLQNSNKSEIMKLSQLNVEYRLSDVLKKYTIEWKLVGMFMGGGSAKPRDILTPQGVGYSNALKKVANNLYKIKDWKIRVGDYKDIPSETATWFIDPPYKEGGQHQYKHNNRNIDYNHLAEYCKNRDGQVIVCENTNGGDWLDFKPMVKMRGSNKDSIEVIWSNCKTDYDIEQIGLYDAK